MDDFMVWEGETPIQGLNSDSSYLIQSSLFVEHMECGSSTCTWQGQGYT